MRALTTALESLSTAGQLGSHPASAVVGVAVPGSVQVETVGWAELPCDAAGTPMHRELLIDLASVTKVLSTTTIAMRLVDSGDLDPSAPVRDLIPEFIGEGKDAISVRHLLTHTAGLHPWWPLYCETTDRERAKERAIALPLIAPPGQNWRYSDIGFILAGLVVERASGSDLATAFARLVADPLGLSARYGPVHADEAVTSADSDAWEYQMVASGEPYHSPFTAGDFDGWRDHLLRGEANDGNAHHALGGAAGHAGLFATIDDLLVLGIALAGGEFVSAEVVSRFARPSSTTLEQAGGFRLRQWQVGGRGIDWLWHGGFTGTYFGWSPELGVAVAGAAMRLHGVVGSIEGAASSVRDKPATTEQIQQIMQNFALCVVEDSHTTGAA